jgi:LPXTG-site transpeptidase (sortase) family protein
MNKSIFTLLICGGLIFSTLTMGQSVQAQGISFPAQINKSFTPLAIQPGARARLQVTVFNPNTFDLTSASWTDNLVSIQPGITIAGSPNLSNTCGGNITAAPGGTVLSLSGGTVPRQTDASPGSCTVSVDVTSTTFGNLINTIPANTLRSNGGDGTVTNTTPASATLHVGALRPPSINKTFSPNTMLVGQTSQLTIRIRNNDLGAQLTQASITDNLPAGVILANPVSASLANCGASATVIANAGGSSVSLNNAAIQPNSTCLIRVQVTSAASGIYTNTLPANALQTEQGVTNGFPASTNLNVQDAGLSKSFNPSTIEAGGTSTLTITLRNPTGSSYTGVQISDTLPGNVLTIVPGSAATTCGGSVTITPPRTVTLANGRVPPGTPASPGTCTITVQVTTPADASGGNYRNTIPAGALTTDQGITNGVSASDWLTVYPVGGGISASKSFSPSTIAPGDNSRLRINIPAPADTDLTNFSIVDHLPAGVTVSNSSPATQNNCGSSATISAVTGATSVSLANGTIRAGTTCQINVYVTSSTAGTHTNVIQPSDITNNENRTIPNNITADLNVTTVSLFRISKAFAPPVVSPGGISTLRIILENRNSVPLVNASVTDPLPGDATNGIVVAPTPNASTTCTGGTLVADPGSQTITMTGGTIPAQSQDIPGTCTIRVDVQGRGALSTQTNRIPVVNASGTLQGTNTVLSPTDPAQANLVIGNLSIGIVKGFDPLTVFGGSASTLSIEIINPNNVTMDGIQFTDNMPAGMFIADPPGSSVGDCGGTLNASAGEGSFSYIGGSLAAAANCTLTLRVTMTVNGNLTNVIAANSVSTLAGVTNPDPAEATLTNLPGASISKAFATNPVAAGKVSRLTFTIRNTGTVALTGMGFQDDLPGDLPVGLEIADSPGPSNGCSGTLTAVAGTQRIELVDGALAFDASCTIAVSVVGNIAGSYTNTIEPGRLTSNEGATNHDSTTDTLVITGSAPNGGGGNNGGRGAGKSASPGQTVNGFVIPVTGFAPHVATPLNGIRPRYDATALQIEIPVIGVHTSIVGVQIQNGGWDISWLQDQVGWLNGTAFPTRNGNSVLTAHVVNADGKPGLFSKLKYLGFGEYVYIYSSGYRYTFQVVSSQATKPDDLTAFRHLDKSYLTLITCDQYDVSTSSYLQRVVVRAKLVDVRIQP